MIIELFNGKKIEAKEIYEITRVRLKFMRLDTLTSDLVFIDEIKSIRDK